VAGLTAANGVDNVAVYLLLFNAEPPSAQLLTVATFSVLLVGWCAAAAVVGGHKKVVESLGGLGRWLVPSVFIGIGAWILVRSGALTNILTPP
jgi:cadmium resistance protein CadD (predicted permease)